MSKNTQKKVYLIGITLYRKEINFRENGSLTFEITPENIFDVNIVLFRLADSGQLEDGALGEVRIVSNYVDDELIYTAHSQFSRIFYHRDSY